MGWFSADEIIAPTTNSNTIESNQAAQTVALCIIAAVAVGYVLLRGIVKLQRQHTERVAERTARRMNAQV